jgi:hypothetical protein
VLAGGQLPVTVNHGVRAVAHQTADVDLDGLQRLAAHRLDREAADLVEPRHVATLGHITGSATLTAHTEV